MKARLANALESGFGLLLVVVVAYGASFVVRGVTYGLRAMVHGVPGETMAHRVERGRFGSVQTALMGIHSI